MRIVTLVLFMSSLLCYSQTIMPIYVDGGHVYIYTYDNSENMNRVRILVDTGAEVSICMNERLMRSVVKKMYQLNGLTGSTIIRKCGVMDCIGVSAKVVYLDSDNPYDGILGLDWMLEHRAVVDLERMVLEYD